MKKYIFLDIDGVIATQQTIIEGEWGLTLSRQELLGDILYKTGAELIISSSWRKHTLELTVEHFQKKGFLFCDKIIDVTIRAYHYIQKGIHLSIPRGVEIKQWLDTHAIYPWYAYPERKPEFEIYDSEGNFQKMRSQKLGIDYVYLILDDDGDMLLEHKDYFIRTDCMDGLSYEDSLKAIQILNQYDKS